MDQILAQILLLLGLAVVIVLAFRRLGIPASLGYLLVGLLVSPYTAGPIVDAQLVNLIAEFGIVFLLFTIGLGFSIPQINALRGLVPGLGAAQVTLTTAIVAGLLWLAGAPLESAFVVGAVFAQSSTTIIRKQLLEQHEEHSPHGRLGTAMSVFQDVTAVPFVVIIPALGMAVGAGALTASLGLATVKAALAFLVVFVAGRWLLRPLFHAVAQRRSPELFTLTVLLVSLSAAWMTNLMGLSMAFGGFLAGMMLGETEFRHQVEATIRPFRDVLLGLFFIGIGMLFNPVLLADAWPLVIGGAVLLMTAKAALVALAVRCTGRSMVMAWRTGLLLSVGGEFGFALLAIAMKSGAIPEQTGQVTLMAVLLSMIVAPLVIRHNEAIARRLSPREDESRSAQQEPFRDIADHVIICGYGRIGQSIGRFLRAEQVPCIAFDFDAERVRQAHRAGEPVFYGDTSDPEVLESASIGKARLIVISHNDLNAAMTTLRHARSAHPHLPVMVRTRDETHAAALREAGASEVVPETLEASLMIAAHVLLLLGVDETEIMSRVREQQADRYPWMRDAFGGKSITLEGMDRETESLRLFSIPGQGALIGATIADLNPGDATTVALLRERERIWAPDPATRLQAHDRLLLLGARASLDRVACLLSEHGTASGERE